MLASAFAILSDRFSRSATDRSGSKAPVRRHSGFDKRATRPNPVSQGAELAAPKRTLAGSGRLSESGCGMNVRLAHLWPITLRCSRKVEMQLGKSPSSIALLCARAPTGCAHARGGGTDAQSCRAERSREVEGLVAQATPSNLAAAALLAAPGELNARQPLDLIERAEALAPQRPELAWLHLAICERLRCDTKAQIAAHLQALDPDNGFAWFSDLERAPSGPDAAALRFD